MKTSKAAQLAENNADEVVCSFPVSVHLPSSFWHDLLFFNREFDRGRRSGLSKGLDILYYIKTDRNVNSRTDKRLCMCSADIFKHVLVCNLTYR